MDEKNIFKINLEGDELHIKLGGGLPKSSIILVEAPAGLGKSVLAQRFTYGALKNDVRVSYISSELTVQSFLNQMDSFRYDIRTKFLDNELKFITLFPALGRVKFEPDLVKKLFNSKKLLDSDIIIIDSLNNTLLRNDSGLEDTFNLISTFKKIASQQKSVILCVEPGTISKEMLTNLQNLADVHIVMEERDQYGNKLNILQVKRFTGAAGDVEKELPFKVRAGIGIVVELAS